jgi:ribosome modulation factor
LSPNTQVSACVFFKISVAFLESISYIGFVDDDTTRRKKMTSEQRIVNELTSQPRAGWERNGYQDGLDGRTDRMSFPHQSTRDSYMLGWRDGDQVRRIVEAWGQQAIIGEK